jgi:hypothetical protein
MDEVVGCCGLICNKCQVYEATQNQDGELRATAYQRHIDWGHGDRFRELYGREYRVEDVSCDGCPTQSPRDFWYIENCQMRACALGKGHPNCAHCGEYPCETLQAFFDKSHVNARETLDEIHSRLAKDR